MAAGMVMSKNTPHVTGEMETRLVMSRGHLDSIINELSAVFGVKIAALWVGLASSANGPKIKLRMLPQGSSDLDEKHSKMADYICSPSSHAGKDGVYVMIGLISERQADTMFDENCTNNSEAAFAECLALAWAWHLNLLKITEIKAMIDNPLLSPVVGAIKRYQES